VVPVAGATTSRAVPKAPAVPAPPIVLAREAVRSQPVAPNVPVPTVVGQPAPVRIGLVPIAAALPIGERLDRAATGLVARKR
jgi:hypothetical protein